MNVIFVGCLMLAATTPCLAQQRQTPVSQQPPAYEYPVAQPGTSQAVLHAPQEVLSGAVVEEAISAQPTAAQPAVPGALAHHSITPLPSKGVVSFFTKMEGPGMVEYRIENAATGAVIAHWASTEAREQQFVNVEEAKFREGAFVWTITNASGKRLKIVPFTSADCQQKTIADQSN